MLDYVSDNEHEHYYLFCIHYLYFMTSTLFQIGFMIKMLVEAIFQNANHDSVRVKKILILIFTTHWNIQYVQSLFNVIICDHSSLKCLITIFKFRKDTLKKCYSLYTNVEFTGKFVFRSRFGWSHSAEWSSFMQEKSHIELSRWFRNLISN